MMTVKVYSINILQMYLYFLFFNLKYHSNFSTAENMKKILYSFTSPGEI